MRAGLDNKKGKTDEEDKEGTPAVNKGVAGLALHPLFVPVVTTLIMIAVMSTYIAVLEMTLKVNDMKGVDEVNSTGQLLALLLGGFTCFKALLSMVETLRGGGNDAGGEKGGDVEK
ncbi:hypothetical protein HXX76_011521 [Chlamydomonas incerta]|uniref:Uncharacterized protein n=1 Tax=Chlamydomonas incerta TaxID=51695 RepID=A0A835SMP2_CHLIN|nr:hypothetical protein HXX76_011521 [Chlamydomonas incerta]|eukprot:KAG2428401.1 hypothetical protein HXX76_011521 [Chlamydomonas incerta]